MQLSTLPAFPLLANESTRAICPHGSHRKLSHRDLLLMRLWPSRIYGYWYLSSSLQNRDWSWHLIHSYHAAVFLPESPDPLLIRLEQPGIGPIPRPGQAILGDFNSGKTTCPFDPAVPLGVAREHWKHLSFPYHSLVCDIGTIHASFPLSDLAYFAVKAPPSHLTFAFYDARLFPFLLVRWPQARVHLTPLHARNHSLSDSQITLQTLGLI